MPQLFNGYHEQTFGQVSSTTKLLSTLRLKKNKGGQSFDSLLRSFIKSLMGGI